LELGRGDCAVRLKGVPKNRKKAETYRFNGYPHCDPGSIHSVEVGQLEARIKEFEAKLADPDDPDDKKWIARWLLRYVRERDKKFEGLVLNIKGKRRLRIPQQGTI
jgi:hypothetical protein